MPDSDGQNLDPAEYIHLDLVIYDNGLVVFDRGSEDRSDDRRYTPKTDTRPGFNGVMISTTLTDYYATTLTPEALSALLSELDIKAIDEVTQPAGKGFARHYLLTAVSGQPRVTAINGPLSGNDSGARDNDPLFSQGAGTYYVSADADEVNANRHALPPALLSAADLLRDYYSSSATKLQPNHYDISFTESTRRAVALPWPTDLPEIDLTTAAAGKTHGSASITAEIDADTYAEFQKELLLHTNTAYEIDGRKWHVNLLRYASPPDSEAILQTIKAGSR